MRGLIIGRFLPLHRGHQYLIDTALTIVSHLTICVRDTQDATIPLTTRMAWLKEMYPEAQVIGMPDLEDDLDTQAWVTHTQSFLGFTPDIFFSSETYGDDFAKILGIRHFMVDQARLAFPVYAAEVRKDPFRYWNYLEPCVRSYFA
ncbi:MAG: adenylyltransferase/cytidyltransferase family protein, partial [Holophagaceae bacterium]